MTIKIPAGLAWFIHHMLILLLGQELTEILSKMEMDTAPRTMSHMGLSNDKQENALP